MRTSQLYPPSAATLVELLRLRAEQQADEQLYTFLTSGDTPDDTLTYAELDRRAKAVGALLQQHSAAGERVLLLYPPGLDYIVAFFGCLYAGAIAVPAYPPQLNRPAPRLQAIVADAQATIALTTTQILANMEQRFAHAPDLAALRWLTIDALNTDLAAQWQESSLNGGTLAFLQYTSGSTSTPKGVMLTHGNLLHNLGQIQRCFGHTTDSRGVIWLPPYHDMGLIGGVLQPLYVGFPVALMAPIAFLQRPYRWLQAISECGGTTSGGPNFAYDLCARKVTPEQRATLDLSRWQVAFTGAEPIRRETLDLFAATFAECGFRREAFYPCYGLAEATLIVSGGEIAAPPVVRSFQASALEQNRVVAEDAEDEGSRVLVSCGRNLPDQQIVIAHPETHAQCAPGEIGEVWVVSPSVAKGYWSQPEATERTFGARLAGSGDGPFLRTGDLGFLQDGELFITGRLKDLIIIRGRNHYPQDIELTVEQSYPGLRPGGGAAFAIEAAGEERLVVVQEVERRAKDANIDEVAAAIRQHVAANHDVQVYGVVLIKPGSIPKTSSGKIQRHACRVKFEDGTLELIGKSVLDETSAAAVEITTLLSREALEALPSHERQAALETYLREQIAQELRVEVGRLQANQAVSALGLDSLSAVELTSRIELDLNVVVPMVALLQGHTIAQIAAEILEQLESAPSEILPSAAPNAEAEYPLSYGQRALWFLYQLAPDSAAYTIASAVRIRSELDLAGLRRALQTVVDRHAALRTIFVTRDGEPVQQIQPHAEIALEATDAAGWGEAALHERLAAEANRPFDLATGPLLRVQVFSRAHNDHVLLLAIHHIVADFWSLAVLIHELGQLYTTDQGEAVVALAEPELLYTDYARWQTAMLSRAEGEQLWSFWHDQLVGAQTILNLPTDRPRPATQTYRGAAHGFRLDPALSQALAAFGEERGLTRYMTLLAAFQVLLFRYTGQDDLLVGSTTAGRSRAKLANVVGYFVNPIVLRARLGGNPSFAAFAERVRQTVLAAFAHQDYPLPLLVERLQPERDPSRSPLFQVLFSFQQTPLLDREGLAAFALGESGARLVLGELQVESVALEQRSAQFDLTLTIAPTADGLGGAFQYNSDLFDSATIERMVGHFQALLAGMVANPEQPIADLPLLTAAEQQTLLDWNRTEAAYSREATIHRLFEAQADRVPDAIALRAEDGALTYAELDRRANQLANHLRTLGIGPDSLVGICVERGLALLVGVLGVLKAGGAYIPLDPAYPAERLQYMLENAQVPVLLTQQNLVATLPPHSAQVVCLDADWPTIAQARQEHPNVAVSAANLAYIIYTSGSTGRPKGVQIPHGAAVNFLLSMQRQPGLTERDVLLAVTTLSFDIAGLELFLPLITGARIELASREVAADGTRLLARLVESGTTVLQATPATWRLLIEAGWQHTPSLTALCGGEALPPDLARQILDRGATLWNMYGPTETTIWSAVDEVTPTDPTIAIGHPIANTQIYILDNRLNPVPVGVPGDLYIGGDGLARGYLHQPALTSERFIPDPFSSTAGARLYWTGDLARYLPDGRIEYLGRIDHQVKVRGYRIELGEIESVLAQHPAVSGAVVVVREDVPGDLRIVAYVVAPGPHPPTPAPSGYPTFAGEGEPGGPSPSPAGAGEGVVQRTGGEGLSSALRTFLREHLPNYMIPSAFVPLEAFPLTPNGKVDRKALPAPADVQIERSAEYVAPRTELEQTIAGIWQEVLHLEQVGLHDNFFDLGGHSLLLAQAHSKLRAALNSELTLVDLFRYPTISTLAGYLSSEQPGPSATQQAIERANQRRAATTKQTTEIAIIGMHARFPGASTIEEFWENLRGGVNAITFFSDQELEAEGVDPAVLRDPSYVKARGILDNIDSFDANFFGITPREAQVMDPQHRIFLECAWHALEHAGYDSARYPGRIGVFTGVGINTYLLYASRASMEVAGRYQAFIGNDKDFVPTRVSYKLNLRGPSVNVQTACSSSLVAVHLACQSLLLGESDMAMAGGITISVPHKAGYFYEAGGIPSPDGYCRAFDADAQGTVFGNGVGIVVLKRLEDAIRDGDTIHAVIRGSAINNDGANKVGYTAPSVDGQTEVIAEALSVANVTPDTIDYIEAHGTGTPLGDPIEIAALTQAFGTASVQPQSCRIGSVKASIGHLDTAAGVAGLIKTVLALKHEQIPPSLHYTAPNPKIDFASSPFYVNTELTSWHTNGHPRRAGVSSFGIGGTNAHLIVEEAPLQESDPPARPWHLLVVSAKSSAALDAATANLANYLQSNPDLNLANVAYTLQVGRSAFEHRRALVCRDQAEAAGALQTLDPERVFSGVWQPGERPVIWMFPGQGAQYVGMGRELYESEPVFKAAVDRCCAILEPHLGLDLRTMLYPTDDDISAATDQLTQTQIAQPALFVIEYALAQLWQSWGIQPQTMIGHSIGEYVAACLAGVFSLEDALSLVATRGRLMQALPPGAMLAVPLPEADLLPLLGNDLDLAAVNGPKHCVVSGTTAAIAALEHELTAREITSRRLHTSHAFHSAMLEPMLDDFAEAVRKIRLSAPQLPYISNLTGAWITAEEATDPGYWTRQIRQPVRFAAGLETLLTDRDAVLLEVGPGTTLSTFARQQPKQPLALPSLRHPQSRQADHEFLLTTLGKLWLGGVTIDWQRLYAGAHGAERRLRVPLPLYPFERQRYWIEAQTFEQPAKPKVAPATRQPDIADWFYAPLWKQSVAPAPFDAQRSNGQQERWLLFADGCGLGAQMANRLRDAGQDVITVAIGAGFEQLGPTTYTIDPGERADYDLLLEAISAADAPPTTIVHLWSVTPTDLPSSALDRMQQAQTQGFYSLLYLAQALEKQRVTVPVRIGVLSNNMQKVAGEQTLHPEKATVLGPCKVLPQEYGHLSCRSIDLVLARPGSSDEEDLVDQLLGELLSSSEDRVIAYRGTDRWVQTFEPVRLDGKARIASRLQPGGAYLITGGLGGIGLVLAEHLARTLQARLVLTGRTALPERDEWADWLATHAESDATSRKIRSIQMLESLGAEVLLANADVTDLHQMRAAIEQAIERFGAIHGVIHAAGIAGGGMVQLKTPAIAERVLAPKVQGTLVLHSLLNEIRPRFLVLCSSINAVIGGFGQSDYSAANTFMDAFAASHTSRRGTLIASINWDRWQETGMAVATDVPQGFKELQRAHKGQIAHPLLGRIVSETEDKIAYLGEFNGSREWVLAEHKIVGSPTVPGTTYLEMVRAAFEKQAADGLTEIRDVIFIAPLIVGDDETRDVLTVLERQGDSYEFKVFSRAHEQHSDAWQEHVTGNVRRVPLDSAPYIDLQAVQARCNLSTLTFSADQSEDNGGFLEAGPRWRNLKTVHFGATEGLAELELAEEFADDLHTFKLHPALLDVATGSVQRLGKGNYLPLTYQSLQIRQPLPRKVYSYVRQKDDNAGPQEILTCDISLVDEYGTELVTIESFSMKRVGNDAIALLKEQARHAEPILVSSTTTAVDGNGSVEPDGILSREGIIAFERILEGSMLPQVVVSTKDLQGVIAEANAFTTEQILENFEQIALPQVVHARPNIASAYIAPGSDLESRIAGIWQRVLGIDQIGVHDNFFELGGTSLSGIQIISELKKELGVEVPTVSIFEAPTVHALAKLLRPDQTEQDSFQQARSRAERKLGRKRK